jgi:hypothetical protein
MPNENTFDADIDYALRMIREGCATVEQAARTCGIPVRILQSRLKSITPGSPAQAKTSRAKASKKMSV